MKNDHDPFLSNQSLKSRKLKSRGVSSRYLSPSHDKTSSPSPSPSQASSPVRHKTSTDHNRKHKSLEDSAFLHGLWPSSSPSHPSSNTTLADHLGDDRLRDFLEKKTSEKSSAFSLPRQRSCSDHGRFENDKEKENHRPILGGSMRYTGRFLLDKFSSSSSSSSNSSSNTLSGFVPGRLSVDENALYKNYKTTGWRKSDSSMENLEAESEASENLSDSKSGKNWRKSEIASKYRRGKSDSNIQAPVSSESSPKRKNSTIKSAIKRASSLTTGYGSATSQWALSPGRSGSPPISVESKERLMSFSNLKPPSSPSKSKGVEKLLNLGLDLFKGKKSSSSSGLSVTGAGNLDAIHQLRLLHNRMLQWRFANARAEVVNGNITKQAEENLVSASDNLVNLRRSVLLKRLQLQKEKMEMKLDFMLQSQIKQLEAWGDMERQHSAAVLKTKEFLHSVVCKVPLIDGVKADPQLTCIALRHASDLSASINSALITFSLPTEETAGLLSQLAEVVSQEKLLLEECLELLQTISLLEIQERSCRCYLIQLNSWLQQQHQPQEIVS